MNRAQAHTVVQLTDVLKAELTGGEDEVRAALSGLDESALSRLRNAMHNIAELAEARRKGLRYARGLR
jgi:hypothetical protein